MNTMTKTLVMVFSLFLFGANAYAAETTPGYSHVSGSRTIPLPVVNTKEKAYSLGFQKLQDLKEMQSSTSLSDALRIFLYDKKAKESVTINEANITVQELMNEQGEIVYGGMVNVTYHYSVKLEPAN
jgi:hypothetical protein